MEKHLSLSFQIPSQKSFSKHTFPPFEPEGSSCKEQSRATIIHQFFQLIEAIENSNCSNPSSPCTSCASKERTLRRETSIPFRVINRTRRGLDHLSCSLSSKEIGSFELSNYLIALVNAVFPFHDWFIGGSNDRGDHKESPRFPFSPHPIWNHVENRYRIREMITQKTLIKIEIANVSPFPSKVIK